MENYDIRVLYLSVTESSLTIKYGLKRFNSQDNKHTSKTGSIRSLYNFLSAITIQCMRNLW